MGPNLTSFSSFLPPSVDSLSLIDLGRGVKHSKVVSLAEHSNKVSSLELTIFLDKSHGPLAPLGFIKTNIAQIQLVVLTPFVMQIVVRYLAKQHCSSERRHSK